MEYEIILVDRLCKLTQWVMGTGNTIYMVLFNLEGWVMSYQTEVGTKWPTFPRHFQMLFLEWKWIHLIKISLKFVTKVPINNIVELLKIMAWHLPGDKPLSEPVMVNSLMHICVTRPKWVERPEIFTCSSLVLAMASHQFGELRWYHMSFMALKITGKSRVCWTIWSV